MRGGILPSSSSAQDIRDKEDRRKRRHRLESILTEAGKSSPSSLDEMFRRNEEEKKAAPNPPFSTLQRPPIIPLGPFPLLHPRRFGLSPIEWQRFFSFFQLRPFLEPLGLGPIVPSVSKLSILPSPFLPLTRPSGGFVRARTNPCLCMAN